MRRTLLEERATSLEQSHRHRCPEPRAISPARLHQCVRLAAPHMPNRALVLVTVMPTLLGWWDCSKAEIQHAATTLL